VEKPDLGVLYLLYVPYSKITYIRLITAIQNTMSVSGGQLPWEVLREFSSWQTRRIPQC